MDNNSKIPFRFQLIFVGLIILLVGCKVNKNPDVSDIDVNLNIIRFEKKLFNIDTTNTLASFVNLKEEYPAFVELFFNHVLPLRDVKSPKDDKILAKNISSFINDDFAKSVYDTTQIVYPEMKEVSEKLTSTLKYVKYYFPEVEVENVYTFVSEFGYQTFIFSEKDGKDAIGVGLDLFLNDYPYKRFAQTNASFSDYLTRAFTKEHIPKRIAEAIIDDILKPEKGERLLDKMIQNGKKQYLLKKFMPFEQDSIIFEHSGKQMEWVKENELNIWVHLLSEELIYDTNRKKIKSLIDFSPTSKGMPDEAPGRTANYTAYRIIEKFMQRNPEIELDSMINISDPQFILDNARYKPTAKR